MDIGVLVLGLLALSFVLLAGLAVKKMTNKRLGSGEAPALEGDAELEREALSAGTPDAPRQPTTENEPATEKEADRLRRGLEKTKKGFMARLNELLFKELDEALVDELESLMVTSDIGIRSTERLLGDLKGELSRKEIRDPKVVRTRLKDKVREIVQLPLVPWSFEHKPKVVMVIGVNGVGKTTTIGKLARRFTDQGKKVVLGAGDTFRAAAAEQLEIWGERANAIVVRGQEGADPASVIFEAVQRAVREKADLCLCDTAGRLHTKVNLMEELKKVRRVMGKAMEGAPHEVLLVLDATTGQNAISQAKQFKDAVEVSSLALTKLDGTAKGGVVVAICDDLQVPVRFVGIGEKAEDLRDFDPEAFVDALFED